MTSTRRIQPFDAMRRVVSDTGPLISLEKLSGGVRLMHQLYDRIIVPPAVLAEVSYDEGRPENYLERYGLKNLLTVEDVQSDVQIPGIKRLHEGEIQAIRLALELELPLLIEETAGRRAAQEAGCLISGIAGQIVKAHRNGFLKKDQAREMLAEMVRNRRINERIYDRLVSTLKRES